MTGLDEHICKVVSELAPFKELALPEDLRKTSLNTAIDNARRKRAAKACL